MTGQCSCGAVSVQLAAAPTFIHDCNCTLCRRADAAWGYFTAAQVQYSGQTHCFEREDKANPTVTLHACSRCDTTVRFELSAAYKAQHPDIDQVGVNMKLFAQEDLSGIEIRYPDGLAWSGTGPFGYRRAPAIAASDTLWAD